MPLIDIIQNGAFDTRTFFAPDTTPITAITGTATLVTVTLQGGLTLVYTGTGLQFSGTTPTAGQITKVQVLRPDGAEAARMDLTPAPWNFAEITTAAPLQSYLANPHRQVYDFEVMQTLVTNSFFQGGNQADDMQGLFGTDTLLGGGGDDLIRVPTQAVPTRASHAGTILDGGAGNDRLELTGSGEMDFRAARIANFETLAIRDGSLLISGAQLGKGGIAPTIAIQTTTVSAPALIVEQVAGRAVNLGGLNIISAPFQSVILQVTGTTGDDVQRGNVRSADLLFGGDGADRLFGGGGADSLYGGTGDDRLYAGDDGATQPVMPGMNPDELRGGAGNDRIYGGIGISDLLGEAGNDTIVGATGLVFADGGDGDDYIKGGSATFPAFGGGAASSNLSGGAGNDTLVSGAVGTFMAGGTGDDRYVIDHANTVLEELSGNGNDRAVTTVSVDLTTAGEVELITVAATTGVAVTGTATANIIKGNIGPDTLNGGAGDDRVSGGAGADSLNGGLGNDTISGGAGADLFVFDTGSGSDTISDFTGGLDRIDVSNIAAVTDFADLAANHMRQVGSAVVIDAGNGDVLTLRTTWLAQLEATDFLI